MARMSATPNAFGVLESSVNTECGAVTTRRSDGTDIDTGVFRNVSPLRWAAIALAPVAGLFVLLGALDAIALSLAAEGRPNADIARRLFLSEKTVRNHVSSIFAKLGVTDRAAAVARARDAGLGA